MTGSTSSSRATPNGSPGRDALTRLADAIREKYDGEWDFTPQDDGFGHTDESGDSHIAYVYRVSPDKVLAFAKSPHGQTRFRPL